VPERRASALVSVFMASTMAMTWCSSTLPPGFTLTLETIPGIEAHAEAAARAIDRDFAGVRREVVHGILGRDAALDRIAVDRQVILIFDINLRMGYIIAFGDLDPRAPDRRGDHSVTVCSTWMRGFISIK